MRPLIALVALSSLFAHPSRASTVLHESIEEMAQRVPLIVRATAVRSVAGYDDSRKRIWTWTELQVTDTIKGYVTSPTLLVKQPGGEVEGFVQTVSGTAQFQVGEECIVFLEPAPDEKTVYRVSSLAAGKVQLTTWNGQPAALRDMRGLGLAGKAGVVTVQGPEFLGSPDAFVAKLKLIGRGGR